jgi:DNA-binding protein HU-beta
MTAFFFCCASRTFAAVDAREKRDLHSAPVDATLIENGIRERSVNKNDLVDAIASSGNMTKADATQAVDTVIDAITNALKKGDEVRIAGFGTFVVSQRAASEGRNPRTGEKIQIPASKLPKFRAGKGLKDAIQ